jgi:hypothetical protein
LGNGHYRNPEFAKRRRSLLQGHLLKNPTKNEVLLSYMSLKSYLGYAIKLVDGGNILSSQNTDEAIHETNCFHQKSSIITPVLKYKASGVNVYTQSG